MWSTMYLDADDILVISKVYNLILRCKRSQDKGDVILSFSIKFIILITEYDKKQKIIK